MKNDISSNDADFFGTFHVPKPWCGVDISKMYTKYCGLYSNKPILLVALMWPFLPFIAFLLSTIKNATTTNIAHLLVLIPNVYSLISLFLSIARLAQYHTFWNIQHSFTSFLLVPIARQSVSQNQNILRTEKMKKENQRNQMTKEHWTKICYTKTSNW